MDSNSQVTPNWGPLEKLLFLLTYAWAKIAVLWEVKNVGLKFFWFELQYSFGNLLNHFLGPEWVSITWRGQNHLDTRWGHFEVRPGTQDAAILSPAFERADWIYLLRLCRRELSARRKILFVDIGAHVGRFSVALANEFRNSDLKIMAFEPDKKNQISFRHHMEINRITPEKITLYGQALGAKTESLPLYGNDVQPGNNSMLQSIDSRHVPLGDVQVSPLDDFLTLLPKDLSLVIKIDVEGFEREVLKGAQQILKHFKNIFICIEDMYHCHELYQLLIASGAKPLTKLTSYNSWWTIQN